MEAIDLRHYKKRFPENVEICLEKFYPVQFISGKIKTMKGSEINRCDFLIDYIFIKKNKYKYDKSRD